MSQQSLANLSVLLTRPVGQVQALAELVQAEGGKAVVFPTIAVRALTDNPEAVARINALASYKLVIFISSNAVEYFSKIYTCPQHPWPAQAEVAALGAATAQQLLARNFPANIVPSKLFSSETLLAHPRLQQVRGEKIAIVRGRGGRELLAQTLRERGAIVEYIEVYSRELPDWVDTSALALWCQASRIAVLTSAEGIDNLLTLVGKPWRDCVLNAPLVLASERLRQHALSLGFCSKLIVAENASDSSIVEALQHYKSVQLYQP